jgi:hypothetical protein
MSHLSIERLAALADEQPSADEQHHLSGCAECSRELEAHRSLLAMAGGERESIGMPLTRWDALSERLHREGLILDRRAPRRSSWALQVAAALLLVAGGVALGRKTANAPIIPGIDAVPTQAASVSTPDPVPVTPDSATPAVMRTRLAALNEVYKTMQEALSDAPHDPVVNTYYRNSFEQREATLRQLNTVLPQNVRLNSF